MWKHVIEWSHSIEVDYKPEDGKAVLAKVYFPFDPKVHKVCQQLNCFLKWTSYNPKTSKRHLGEARKEIVKSKLDRDSGPDKLASLLSWIISIRNNVKYNVS